MLVRAFAALACLALLAACPGERPKTDAHYTPDRRRPREARATEGGPPPTSFTDVPSGRQFAQAIAWTTSHKYLEPCKTAPLSFCPDDSLQRDWAAASSVRMKLGESFTSTTSPFYSDVPASYWAFRYIQEVTDLKVMNGCGDGTTFCPTASLSRAQAASLLIRLKFGDSFTPAATPYFTDVPAASWAFNYVQKAYEAGFTYGCTTTTFCPDQPITRAEWAAFLYALQTL